MRYRQLGDSGMEVSEIALGSWLTYVVGVNRDQAAACVHAALDAGITLIDTANVYGKGAAEDFLGEVLVDVPRDRYLIATKLFFPMTDTDRGLSRAQVEKQLDASLKRLKVDVIDLYQCHRADPDTPVAETMDALSRPVEAGKVRHLGFSEWSGDAIRDALAVPGSTKFVSSQPQYSLFWRQPEKEIIPLCRENGIGQIVWSPLAQGLLTGKYKRGQPPPEGSRASSDEMGDPIKGWMREPLLRAALELIGVAREANLTLAQFALAWVLREPDVSAAIIGASRPEQVEENCRASGAEVEPALFERAEAIAARARDESKAEGSGRTSG